MRNQTRSGCEKYNYIGSLAEIEPAALQFRCIALTNWATESSCRALSASSCIYNPDNSDNLSSILIILIICFPFLCSFALLKLWMFCNRFRNSRLFYWKYYNTILLKALLYCKQRNDIVKKFYFQGVLIKVSYSAYQRLITIDILYTLDIDFPKSAVRGSWKRRTFVTRKRAKFTGAFLLRWRQWMLIIILY